MQKTLNQIFNGWLASGGIPCIPGPGVQLGRKTVSDAAYTALITNFYIALTALTASRTVTLPAVATTTAGQMLVIADEAGAAGTYNIVVDGNASETIDGALNVTINTNYGYCVLVSTGAAWKVIGGTLTPKNILGRTTVNDTAYTIKVTDGYVGYTALSAGRIATLPAIATVPPGQMFILADEAGAAGTSNLTLKGNAAENIDGANTKVISANYGVLRVVAAGTSWKAV